MSSKVWIDLTDIELWAGHHGGTQRVVYGIAKHFYLSENEEVSFFAYSSAKNAFYETSFEPIYSRVESLKDQTTLSAIVDVSLRQRIKARILPYVPQAIRKNKVLKARAKRTVNYAIAQYKRLNNIRLKLQPKPIRDTGKKIVFSDSDIVLMLGKPWDDAGIQSLLDIQKKNADFKLVQVVYDLIISLYPHLHHPSLFDPYTQHMFKVAQSSDLLLPISESSKNDFAEFCNRLNLPIPKANVIRLGDEIETINATRPDVANLSDNFILCVGTIENRKNHALLYSAYKLAEERGISLPQLVIVGGNGWLADDIRYLIMNDLSMRDKIIVLNNLSDSSLAWMYQNTLFTAYPSLYEGWGLPVAESLAYGRPCVASNASSIPEIGGDLVKYFSPNSTDECLEAIHSMMNQTYRISVEQSIKKNYKKTSWSDTYNQVLDSIKQLR
jgi:glycosyltransferase involved in cell wall biosynthesis